jgi:hypothetical protein
MSTWTAPWGTIYNFDHVEAIRDISNTIKPGFHKAKEDFTPTWWQRVFWERPSKVKGHYYDNYCGKERTRGVAVYGPSILMVWTTSSRYGTEWEFDTVEEKEECLNAFRTYKSCKFTS